MGYGTEMDGCGRFMKYSLFLTNFIIFVSFSLIWLYQRYNRHIIIDIIIDNYLLKNLLLIIYISDWRDYCDGFRRVGLNRQSIMDRWTRGKWPVNWISLCFADWRNHRGLYRFLRMYWCIAGSQVYALDSKYLELSCTLKLEYLIYRNLANITSLHD